MKKLLSLIIFSIILIACKQKTKGTTTSLTQKSIISIDTTIELKNHNKYKSKDQSFVYFLEELQSAIDNKDIKYINSCLKSPFTFSSGGEEMSYHNYEEMQKDGVGLEEFNKIVEAKLISKKQYYRMEYRDNTIDPSIEGAYIITYFILKENGKFKIVSFQEPF